MDIRQYYEQSATASLNASLVAFIPPTLLLIYSVVVTQLFQLLILEIPFLIYSFYCYQIYLLNKKRSQTVNITSLGDRLSNSDLFAEAALLLAFLPAPSLRLLFFNPSGIQVGEIRDRSFFLIRWFLPYFIDRLFMRKFGLYDQHDQPLLYYHLHKERIEIMEVNGDNLMTVYKVQKENQKEEYLLENTSVVIEKKGIPTDYSFITFEDRMIGQIQTGWMPTEWGRRFANPNTPILTIDVSAGKKDRIQLLALLITIYIFTNH